jgi:DNA-binding transcriptional LysR family regulator
MELNPLRAFLSVATEKSFSRAAEKLHRTQPAVSLSVQRLEQALGEKLIDRSAREILLTDAGQIAFEFARRFENLQADLENALAELKDKRAGRLIIGANESSTLYLLDDIERYRKKYPRVRVQIQRSQSSRIPAQLLDGELELGIITYDPEDDRLQSVVIYTDHLAFIVSPQHRLAGVKSVSLKDLGEETFIAHNVVSPYRAQVLHAFHRHKVTLNMDLEMPTIESIRKMVERNEGVAFLPAMCVAHEVRHGLLKEVKVKELEIERQIRLVYPARRALSHAAQAFVGLATASRAGAAE